MNEQQLHARLEDLAHDLAPGGDPYGMVAGARAVHRRRRRARIGVAGAAVAVALVAVGVPTVAGSLSAPDRPDVAAPTTGVAPTPSSAVPAVGDEELVQPAEDLRDALLRVGTGPVPDPAVDVPCPDVAEQLSTATGMFDMEPVDTNATLTVVGGCNWSTDASRDTPEIDQYHLNLTAHPEITESEAIDAVEALVDQGGCSSIHPLPQEEFLTILMQCSQSEQVFWHLLVVDEDGTGGWELVAAVGKQVPEGYGLYLSGLRSLWDVVRNVLPGEPRISPINLAFNDVVNGFDSRPRPVSLSAPSTAMSCPELPAALARRVDTAPEEVRGPGASLTCTWGSDGGPSFSLGLTEGATPRVYREAGDITFEDVPGHDGAGTCLGAVLPGTEPAAGLAACDLGGSEQWRLDMADAGGKGVWTIGLELPSGTTEGSAAAVLALVDLADARW